MQQMNFTRRGNLERKRKAHGKVGPLPRGGLLSLGVIAGEKRFYKFKKAGSATCKALTFHQQHHRVRPVFFLIDENNCLIFAKCFC